MPKMLHCKHILCSPCVDISTENGCECPFCKVSFAIQENPIPTGPGNEPVTQRSKKRTQSLEGESFLEEEDSNRNNNDNRNEDENYHKPCPAHTSNKLLCAKSEAESNDNGGRTLDSSAPSEDLVGLAAPKNGSSESSGWGRNWILCPSDLNKEKKSILNKLTHISDAVVNSSWDEKVTHVIVDVDKNGACGRTSKVLKAILTGKWVLSIEWVKACIEAGHSVPEEPYELTRDNFGSLDGPKLGRFITMQKMRKLFSGWSFHLSNDFEGPSNKKFFEELILAGGGKLLSIDDLVCIEQDIENDETPQKIVFIYNTYPPIRRERKDLERILKQKHDNAQANADAIGGLALAHHVLLDSIAAYRFPMN